MEAQINRQFSSVQSSVFNGFAHPAMYAPHLSLCFQLFPADPHLPSLVKTADPHFMKSILAQLRPLAHEHPSPAAVDLSPVRYKPGRQCLFQYRLHWEHDFHKSNPPYVLWGKVSLKASQAYKTLTTIFTASKGTLFQIPQPLAIFPQLSIYLSGHVPGLRLSEVCSANAFPELCRGVARALLEFHDTPAIVEKKDLPSQLAELQHWTNQFATAVPHHADRIRTVALNITAALAHQNPAPLKLVHGDFHVANILADGKRLGLLDFDNCFLGHPAVDVGSFYAQLKLLSLKLYRNHAALDAAIDCFLDEYLKTCPPNQRHNIPVYSALSCLWCGYFQCIRRPGKRGWFERALVMLTLAESILKTRLS